ncbi:hypothetical protein SAY86_026247 [Trapa natans]|uniref:Uncharacterized protein n=1 Tax=Trapa natans TaxID=22666 RepID=A0AAN7KLE4_TRANT|nr:hypothetical protein SAY86_026247 [Trapa natans]
MKRFKGVATGEPFPYSVGFEDPRARFRFQSLLQDYQDLEQERNALKKKKQIMEQRKLTLLAEVRFLRRRFEYLTRDSSFHLKHLQNPTKGKSRDSKIQSKQTVKKINYAVKEASPQPIVTGFKSNKKTRIVNGKKSVLQNSEPQFIKKPATGKMKAHKNFSPVLNLDEGDSVLLPIRNSRMGYDLNKRERYPTGKEASLQAQARIFDLNQISRDEEELQNNTEFLGIEDARGSSFLEANEEQLDSVTLPACRNVKNGVDRGGKRKITWQDQVALRV